MYYYPSKKPLPTHQQIRESIQDKEQLLVLADIKLKKMARLVSLQLASMTIFTSGVGYLAYALGGG